jgi:hypothetical protein
MSSMGAALPDVQYAASVGAPLLGHVSSVPGTAPNTLHQQYMQAPQFPSPSGQVAGDPHFGYRGPQLHDQRHYSGGPMVYPPASNFGQIHTQSPQYLQQTHPMAYGQMGAGYYPIQNQYVRPPYEIPSGLQYRQQQTFMGSSEPSRASAPYGAVPATSALLQPEQIRENVRAFMKAQLGIY